MFGEFMMCEYWLVVACGLFFVSLFYNFTLRRALASKDGGDLALIKGAYFHPLTHLPNEENIKLVMQEYLERAKRHQKSFMVASISVDALSQSDLVALSHLLVDSLRDEDTVGHIDEQLFVVLFNEYLELENTEMLLQRLHDKLQLERFGDVRISKAYYPEDAQDVQGLISQIKTDSKK